jgi:hypothetical protein
VCVVRVKGMGLSCGKGEKPQVAGWRGLTAVLSIACCLLGRCLQWECIYGRAQMGVLVRRIACCWWTPVSASGGVAGLACGVRVFQPWVAQGRGFKGCAGSVKFN